MPFLTTTNVVIQDVFTRTKHDSNAPIQPDNCKCSICIRRRKDATAVQEEIQRRRVQIPETDDTRRALVFATQAV
jgi:hypothetical protein